MLRKPVSHGWCLNPVCIAKGEPRSKKVDNRGGLAHKSAADGSGCGESNVLGVCYRAAWAQLLRRIWRGGVNSQT